MSFGATKNKLAAATGTCLSVVSILIMCVSISVLDRVVVDAKDRTKESVRALTYTLLAVKDMNVQLDIGQDQGNGILSAQHD